MTHPGCVPSISSHIVLSNISKGNAILLQGVTNSFQSALLFLNCILENTADRCFSVVTFRPCLHIRWFWGLALVIAIFIELNVEDSLTTMGRTLVLG